MSNEAIAARVQASKTGTKQAGHTNKRQSSPHPVTGNRGKVRG